MEDLHAASRPPDTNPAALAVVYIVSAYPSAEREHAGQAIGRVKEQLPSTPVVSVFLPGVSIEPEPSARVGNADKAVGSFVEAVQVCLNRQRPETP
jgi:hypothetical protein